MVRLGREIEDRTVVSSTSLTSVDSRQIYWQG